MTGATWTPKAHSSLLSYGASPAGVDLCLHDLSAKSDVDVATKEGVSVRYRLWAKIFKARFLSGSPRTGILSAANVFSLSGISAYQGIVSSGYAGSLKRL
jgi:hypothetical protein